MNAPGTDRPVPPGRHGKDGDRNWRDRRLILVAQGLRALAYGYSAVLIGVDLHRRGFSRVEVGLVLSAVVAGSALGLLVVGRIADRVGRRGIYFAGYVILAFAGVTLALSPWWWPIAVVALSGTLSAEVMDSGPFTAIEQAMLASLSTGRRRLRGFGVYNAVAAAGGSLGALLAGGTGAVGLAVSSVPSGSNAFLLLVPLAVLGAACAASLSSAVELPPRVTGSPGRSAPVPGGGTTPVSVAAPGARGRLLSTNPPTRRVVLRLSALFGVDSFGAGFTVQVFVAYWLSTRYGASTAATGLLFFGLGLVQTASMLVATRLGERFGLLKTMVFTHLPSNLFLAAVAFAPTLPVAAGLLIGRTALSQMDVPTRQAYVMALVPPEDRVGAASATGLARYITRPAGPVLSSLAQTIFVGFPFLVAGTVKAGYDLALWTWFRRVPLPDEAALNSTSRVVETPTVVSQPAISQPTRSIP